MDLEEYLLFEEECFDWDALRSQGKEEEKKSEPRKSLIQQENEEETVQRNSNGEQEKVEVEETLPPWNSVNSQVRLVFATERSLRSILAQIFRLEKTKLLTLTVTLPFQTIFPRSCSVGSRSQSWRSEKPQIKKTRSLKPPSSPAPTPRFKYKEFSAFKPRVVGNETGDETDDETDDEEKAARRRLAEQLRNTKEKVERAKRNKEKRRELYEERNRTDPQRGKRELSLNTLTEDCVR